MPARKPVDKCMFCDDNPCTCNQTKRAPARKKPVTTILTPATDIPTTLVPTADTIKSDPNPKVAERKGNLLAARKHAKDPELTRAVNVLMEVFGPDVDFLERHRDELDIPPHRIDALIWRRDNAISTNWRGRSVVR